MCPILSSRWGPDNAAHEIASRLQWIGIAFIPAAIYHLSDALLATTGLPSRGRRRRVIRLLYLIGAGFLLMVAFSDSLVQFVSVQESLSIQAGPVFLLYMLYFVLANGFASITCSVRENAAVLNQPRAGWLICKSPF